MIFSSLRIDAKRPYGVTNFKIIENLVNQKYTKGILLRKNSIFDRAGGHAASVENCILEAELSIWFDSQINKWGNFIKKQI